jgi:putative aminopeptidase FrvX
MDKNIKRILEISDEFLQIPSVVGYEKNFLEYLEKKIKELGYKCDLNPKYLVINPHSKKQFIFSAHIDRQGFIKNENGKIEYATNYLKRKKNLSFKREEIEKYEQKLNKFLNENLKGIDTLITDNFLVFKSDNYDNLKFFKQDSGESFEKLALRYVNHSITSYNKNTGEKLGKYKTKNYSLNVKKHIVEYRLDKVVKPNEEVFMLNSNIETFEDKFSGQIDNVISVALLFFLLEKGDFDNQIIFTCEEEIGESYKYIISHFKNLEDKSSKKLIVLDTSPYYDFQDKEKGFITLRNGDERGKFEDSFFDLINKIISKLHLPCEIKESFIGRTELGKVMLNSTKIIGTTIQLPTTNYHTIYETSTIKSLENYYKLISNLKN